MKTVWIVHQYASTPETGMGGRNFYLAQELAKIGYKVYIIASSANHLLTHRKPEFNSDFLFESIEGFTFVWVGMPEYKDAHSKQRVLNWFLFPQRIQKLKRIIKDKPDAILCSSPSPIAFLGAQRLANYFSARLIFEVRDIWPLTLTEIGGYSSSHPFIILMKWIENKAYRDSDRVISNLKNSVDHMVNHGLKKDKFTWIPNGFSLSEVSNAIPLHQSILDKIPKDGFIIGYTGTFGLANDLYTLIDAAKILENIRDIHFVFVGGGKDKDQILEYIESKNIQNIILLDFIQKKQVQNMLANFDALAVGARKEPMYRFGVSPNKLFDYMHAAKPILYYIESGNYRPIFDANAGLEVVSEDAQALANAILQLYQMSEDDRQKLGANGRRVALKEYEYSALASKLENVLFN